MWKQKIGGSASHLGELNIKQETSKIVIIGTMTSGIQFNSIKIQHKRRTTPATFYWRTLWYRVSALSIHIPRQLVLLYWVALWSKWLLREREPRHEQDKVAGKARASWSKQFSLQCNLHWMPKLFFCTFLTMSFEQKMPFYTNTQGSLRIPIA